MKNWLVTRIQQKARTYIKRHKPRIVAVTGSMGKTSTRRAIRLVLAYGSLVRTATKNYNNELGVPLSILGIKEPPGKSPLAWLRALTKQEKPDDIPKTMVLEYGADHPGDINMLCEIARPDVSVVTGISPVHAEYYASVDDIVKEKSSLVKALEKRGIAVLNADDNRVMSMKEITPAKVVTYGLNGHVSAENLTIRTRIDDHFDPDEVFALTEADILVGGQHAGQLRLPNMLGYGAVMSALAAIAVGIQFDIEPAEAIERLNVHFTPTAGRMRPLAGIKGSLIIDDSYNAAPAAMQHGLDVLAQFEPKEQGDRRIAALGQMAELGQYDEEEHRAIGKKVAKSAHMFIAVGPRMKVAVQAAEEAGMSKEDIHYFDTSEKAGRYLDRTIQSGDIVYVKGSQSSRMEKLVLEAMAQPQRAEVLLVRQEKQWK